MSACNAKPCGGVDFVTIMLLFVAMTWVIGQAEKTTRQKVNDRIDQLEQRMNVAPVTTQNPEKQ